MTTQYASQQPAGYSNYIKNVAIVGAGGRSGRQFAKALLATGKHNLTALSRIGSTSKIDSRIKSVPVDYEKPETLIEALRGQDALVITLNARMVKTEQPKLVEAAARARVPWILPNECGFDPLNQALGDETFIEAPKRQVRAQVEELGMSWVGLISGFWYDYSLAVGPNAFGFDFENKTVTFVDDGSTKQNTTTLAQCGEAMAGLLSLPVLPENEGDKAATLSQFRNGFAFVSSFLVSQLEMLESVLRVTGDKREDWTVQTEGHKERFDRAIAQVKAGNMAEFQTQMYTRVLFPGCGDYSSRQPLANELLGLKKVGLDEETAAAVEMVKDGTSIRE